MGLRRSGKSSIQKVSGAAPRPAALPGGSGGRGVGEAPEEGGGRGGGLACPTALSLLLWAAEPEARLAPGPRPRSPRPSPLRPSGSPKAKLAGGRQVPVAPPGISASWDPAPCLLRNRDLLPSSNLENFTDSLSCPFLCVPLSSGDLSLQGFPGEPQGAASERVVTKSLAVGCLLLLLV